MPGNETLTAICSDGLPLQQHKLSYKVIDRFRCFTSHLECELLQVRLCFSCQLSSYLWCLRGKNLPENAGDAKDVGSILGSRRSPGVGNGNPLKYSCLENPMDRGTWRAIVHGVVKESGTT